MSTTDTPISPESSEVATEETVPTDSVIYDTVITDGAVIVDVSDEAAILPTSQVEALLFSTQHPLTPGRIAELLELNSTRTVKRAVAELNHEYENTGRVFRVEQVAGGYQLLTLPEHGELIRKLVTKETDAKLGKSALETLAVIAYKQPILRVDVESIRGVACGEVIRGLMEKHLVKISGRAEIPGRPILYGTTKRFLEIFGLNDLKDLPAPGSESIPRLTEV